MCLEVQKIASRSPAPAVNRLVGVADDKEILMPATEDIHQTVLRLVDVLKFINHDVLQALLPFFADILMFRKDV